MLDFLATSPFPIPRQSRSSCFGCLLSILIVALGCFGLVQAETHGHENPHLKPQPQSHKPAKPHSAAAKPPSSATNSHSETTHESTPPPKGTEVCGTLRLAQEWNLTGSPYIVTGNIFVPITSHLRIEPGVVVKVLAKPKPCPDAEWEKQKSHSEKKSSEKSDSHSAHGAKHGEEAKERVQTPQVRDPSQPPDPADFSDSNYTTITIEGAFYSIGTPKKPVQFMPADTSQGALPWDGIRLTGQREGRAEIGFTQIRGANTGIYVDHAEIFIHHCLFTENNTGLRCGKHGNVTPIFCVFARNRSAGILIEKAVPHVVNNIFWENRGHGIWSDGSKAMVIEYNDFFGNGEADCYRCSHEVLSMGADGQPDSIDAFHNLRVDPLFEESESFLERRQKDPRYDTPGHLIKDTAIAAAEKKTRWKWWKKEVEKKPFQARGVGPYRLSEYSPLIQAGHPAKLLLNTDGSRSDIGLFGGPQDRMTRNPFPGM